MKITKFRMSDSKGIEISAWFGRVRVGFFTRPIVFRAFFKPANHWINAPPGSFQAGIWRLAIAFEKGL